MQTQLRETQSSLQAHVDKIRALDRLVEEHEAIKREVGSMREMLARARSPLPLQLQLEEGEGEGDLGQGASMLARGGSEEEYDDDSDARSVCTIVPEDEQEHDERHNVGRPKTPEPMGHGLMDDEHQAHQNVHEQNNSAQHDQNAMLASRLEALTAQLEQAIAVSQGLQSHAARASSTIAALEAKVNALEEEQRASRVLGGQLGTGAGFGTVSENKSEPESPANDAHESDLARLVKSELMREMERRWDAWRARTEEEREAEKRTLAAALEQVRAVMDGHRPEPTAFSTTDSGAFEARLGEVEGRMGLVEGKVGHVEEIGARMEEANARVRDVDARVGEVEAQVGDVSARVGEVEEHVQDTRSQVAEIRREGRTRADAVRAISGLGSSAMGLDGEGSPLRSHGESSSTLRADGEASSLSSPSARKRIRKRSSRGSSGEDNSSLASSMTHASVSTRATSPSEDECEEDEDGETQTRALEQTPTKGVLPDASSSPGQLDKRAAGGTEDVRAVVQRAVMGMNVKDVVRILLGVVAGVVLTCVVIGCGCACRLGVGSGGCVQPAPVLSAAAVAVVAIGVGAWLMTHRVKD